MKPVVNIKKLNGDSQLPSYNNPDDSGADLFASKDVKWEPITAQLNFRYVMVDNGMRIDNPMVIVGYRAIVPTGISIELPPGYEWQIRSRSGLAAKYNMQVKNSPGTIDTGYRNEIMVILECTGKLPNVAELNPLIKKGSKIAQAVIVKVEQCDFKVVDSLSDSSRGMNGLGSSGVK